MDGLYEIWLTLALGFGGVTAADLCRQWGAERVYRATPDELREFPNLSTYQLNALCKKDLRRAGKIAERCRREGHRVLTWEEEDFPEELRQLEDMPPVLYTWGDVRLLTEGVRVAVVGTRKMDEYGASCAEKLGIQLAGDGFTVVTGLARGIDGMAHRAALERGGRPIGFLGSGLDVLYPPEFAPMIRKTASQGLVVSEYPYGTRPFPKNFPVRNRLMSGVSEAVVVVQAPRKSGALITAHRAADQGKDVFAVPGRMGDEKQEGANQLVSEGAQILTDFGQLREVYHSLIVGRLPVEREKAPEREAPGENIREGLTDPEKRVYHVLQKDGAHNIEEIASETSLPAGKLQAALTLLELKQLIAPLPGSRFIKK